MGVQDFSDTFLICKERINKLLKLVYFQIIICMLISGHMKPQTDMANTRVQVFRQRRKRPCLCISHSRKHVVTCLVEIWASVEVWTAWCFLKGSNAFTVQCINEKALGGLCSHQYGPVRPFALTLRLNSTSFMFITSQVFHEDWDSANQSMYIDLPLGKTILSPNSPWGPSLHVISLWSPSSWPGHSAMKMCFSHIKKFCKKDY